MQDKVFKDWIFRTLVRVRVLIGYVHIHDYTKLIKGTGRQTLDFTLNYCIIYISLTIGTIKCGIII